MNAVSPANTYYFRPKLLAILTFYFGFLIYILFVIHLDICYVYVDSKIYAFRKVKTTKKFRTEGVYANSKRSMRDGNRS